jgi:tetratricopeptide (TPR) repeat protein
VPFEAKDPEVLLLKSDTKLARGDNDSAKFILDDAAARFPQSTTVYNVRGTFFMSRVQKSREAVADFSKSLAINPMQPGVLMSRARAYVALQMTEEALADLFTLARLTPADAGARRTLLTNLLDLGMVDKALDAGKELVRLNNNNADVAMEIGAIFGSGYAKWEQASIFYKDAFTTSKSSDSAAELVVSYLKQVPPQLVEAGTVLQETRDVAETNWPLLLSRARWQAAQTDKVGARVSLTKALTLIGTDNFERLRFWFKVTAEIMPEKKDSVAYLEQLERAGNAPQYMKWFRANLLAQDASTLSQGIELLRSFTDPSVPADLRLANARLLSLILFSANRVEEAMASYRLGIEQFPDDPDLLNNAAYILAKNLGKAEEALPIAEHAVKVAPSSADAYDTLGFVLMTNKKYQDAGRSLEMSFRLANAAGNFRAVVISLIHLGQLYVEMGDIPKAKQTLELAQNWTRQVPSQAKEFEADLADLTKKVE